MRQLTVMRQVLADTIEIEGEDAFLDAFCSRVAEGEDPREIAKSMGMSWYVVKEWMSGGKRREALERAKQCFGDGLMWEGLRIARDSSLEEVPLSRLQVETFHKVAGKMNKVDWGNEGVAGGGFGSGGITIVIGEVKSPYLESNGGAVIEQKVGKNEPVGV